MDNLLQVSTTTQVAQMFDTPYCDMKYKPDSENYLCRYVPGSSGSKKRLMYVQ
jgi:hypothetical protein